MDKQLLRAAGFPEEYNSDVETCKVTHACDPIDLLIGVDKKLKIGNYFWIPPAYSKGRVPRILAIIDEKDDLYRVHFYDDDLVGTIPVGTILIIGQSAKK